MFHKLPICHLVILQQFSFTKYSGLRHIWKPQIVRGKLRAWRLAIHEVKWCDVFVALHCQAFQHE